MQVRQVVEKALGYSPLHGRKDECPDAIHDHLAWVTTKMREELKNMGAPAWEIRQYEGDAIFIPAGDAHSAWATTTRPDGACCAGSPHQVYNTESCVKLALDFLSPEQFQAVLDLTEELRTCVRPAQARFAHGTCRGTVGRHAPCRLPDAHPHKEDKLQVSRTPATVTNDLREAAEACGPCALGWGLCRR